MPCISWAHPYFPVTEMLTLRHGPPWPFQPHSFPQTPASRSWETPCARRPSCPCTAPPGSPASQALFTPRQCQGDISHLDGVEMLLKLSPAVWSLLPPSGSFLCLLLSWLQTHSGCPGGNKSVWHPGLGCLVLAALPTRWAAMYLHSGPGVCLSLGHGSFFPFGLSLPSYRLHRRGDLVASGKMHPQWLEQHQPLSRYQYLSLISYDELLA